MNIFENSVDIKKTHDAFVAYLMSDPKTKVDPIKAAAKRKQADHSQYCMHWETDGVHDEQFHYKDALLTHANNHPNVQSYLLGLKALKVLENEKEN